MKNPAVHAVLFIPDHAGELPVGIPGVETLKPLTLNLHLLLFYPTINTISAD
jgi:hypothetical protein